MTTPKEALELRPCPFCGATPHRGLGKVYHDQLHGEPHQDFSIWCPKGHAKVTGVNAALAADEWNTRETASLQGEDAVERVARIIDPHFRDPMALSLNEHRTEQALVKARTILATGLVPDEAAIRVDEREKCAKIVESDALHDQWPLHGSEMQAPSRRMQIAIAAAIRSGDNP